MSAKPVSFTRLLVGVAPNSLVRPRAFVTSRHVLLPAKTTTKKPAASNKAAATKKPAAAKKSAAKKKPAAKKKKVAAKTPAKRAVRKKAAPKKDAPVVVPRSMVPPKPHNLTPRAVFFSTAFAGNHSFSAPTEEKRAFFAKAHEGFKALSVAEREALEETAQKNRDAYNEQLSAWFKATPFRVRKEIMARIDKRGGKRIRRPRGAVDPSLPPKPLSAFFRFSAETRHSHSGSAREIVKALAENWRSLPETQKQPYLDAANREMAEWKANRPTVPE
ncbi:hypothetical protein CPB85DRAFT_1254492 [Mucidula mucida]|nr:hypothetical protein CPB85DRAFT_1254492 [Mucidula mucida]